MNTTGREDFGFRGRYSKPYDDVKPGFRAERTSKHRRQKQPRRRK